MRRAAWQWIAVFVVCLAAQATIMPALQIARTEPDIVFVALFVFALAFGVMPSIWVGFAIGLLQDIYAPAVLGQNALAKTITGAFCGLFNERMVSADPLMKLVILLVAFLVHDSVFALVDYLKYGTPVIALLGGLAVRTLPRAAFSMVFAGAYFWWEYTRAARHVSI